MKRYLVFFSFLFISVIFWLMNKLAQEYVTVIKILPKIRNTSSVVYSDAGDNTLYVQLSASGYFILRKQFSEKEIFFIDPKNIIEKQQNSLKIPVNNFKEKLKDIYDKNARILSIEPDTVFFNISEHTSKKIPVSADFTLLFKSEFRQSAPVRFSPDSVTVTGLEKDLNEITTVALIPKKYENLDKSVEDILPVAENSGVSVNPSKIRYEIPVERCTEGLISIPINTINVPAENNLILLPAKVNIKYVVPVKDYKSISETDFAVQVDYNDTEESLNRHIKVYLTKKPSSAFDIKIDPCFVEFLIRK